MNRRALENNVGYELREFQYSNKHVFDLEKRSQRLKNDFYEKT